MRDDGDPHRNRTVFESRTRLSLTQFFGKDEAPLGLISSGSSLQLHVLAVHPPHRTKFTDWCSDADENGFQKVHCGQKSITKDAKFGISVIKLGAGGGSTTFQPEPQHGSA